MPRTRATLSDAEALGLAADLPADPQPKTPAKRGPGRPRKATGNAGKIPTRNASGRIASKADMIATVKAQIYVVAAPLLAVWEIRDPECASVMSEPTMTGGDRLEEIIDRIVAIIARNTAVLEFMAKSTALADAGMLVTLLAPIAKKVWQHHGPNGFGHTQDPEAAHGDYSARYPAYAPAPVAG